MRKCIFSNIETDRAMKLKMNVNFMIIDLVKYEITCSHTN